MINDEIQFKKIFLILSQGFNAVGSISINNPKSSKKFLVQILKPLNLDAGDGKLNSEKFETLRNKS